MAWDPNEENSWAWFTKQASEHGGVEQYINDIENNGIEIGRQEMHKEDSRRLPLVVSVSMVLGALLLAGGKKLFDNYKQKLTYQKELKQKSDLAKEELINGGKAAENSFEESAESQISEEEEE